jgi:ubiquinone biosynthesis protein Coq4
MRLVPLFSAIDRDAFVCAAIDNFKAPAIIEKGLTATNGLDRPLPIRLSTDRLENSWRLYNPARQVWDQVWDKAWETSLRNKPGLHLMGSTLQV